MSPTAEQTEERNQHDEKDGSKRSPRRLSIVVWRLHWKALYLDWAVIRSYTNVYHIYFTLRLHCNQVCYLSVFIFYIHISEWRHRCTVNSNTFRVLVKITQVEKTVKPIKYCWDSVPHVCNYKIHRKIPQLCSCPVSNIFRRHWFSYKISDKWTLSRVL